MPVRNKVYEIKKWNQWKITWTAKFIKMQYSGFPEIKLGLYWWRLSVLQHPASNLLTN